MRNVIQLKGYKLATDFRHSKQVWSRLKNRYRKPIRYDSILIQYDKIRFDMKFENLKMIPKKRFDFDIFLLCLGLIGLCPRVPLKLRLFRNFQGERGFANAGVSCECEYLCSHCTCVKVHIQVLVNFAGVLKRFDARIKKGWGKLIPFLSFFYSCSCVRFLSHKVGILA